MTKALLQKRVNNIPTVVQQGIAALDKRKPGWWLTITVERLSVESSTMCVLAHIYGTFEKAPWRLRSRLFAPNLGFYAPNTGGFFVEYYRLLNAEWRRAIAQLQKDAATAASSLFFITLVPY